MTKPYYDNIEVSSIKNKAYRDVQYTDRHMQVVLMTLKPREKIGMETHQGAQFFRVEKGSGLAIIEDKWYILVDGAALTVPSGWRHDIINTSYTNSLHLYTIYSPPQHPSGTFEKHKPLDD